MASPTQSHTETKQAEKIAPKCNNIEWINPVKNQVV